MRRATRASDPVRYDDGAGFLDEELDAALETIGASIDDVRPEDGAEFYAMAKRAVAHLSSLALAVERGELGHAVYHALRLGTYDGILQSHPYQYHLNRRLGEAEPHVERSRRVLAGAQASGHGRKGKTKVPLEDVRQWYVELLAAHDDWSHREICRQLVIRVRRKYSERVGQRTMEIATAKLAVRKRRKKKGAG